MSIIPNTTTESAGIVTTKVMADFTSMVNAIIIAPNTINGDLKNNLSTRLTPVCIWLISLVIRVSNVDVPIVSISVYDSEVMCLNNALLSPVPKPVAALAEKYWAVNEQVRPIIPRSTITRHILRT